MINLPLLGRERGPSGKTFLKCNLHSTMNSDSLSIGSDSQENESNKNGMKYIRQDSLQVSNDGDGDFDENDDDGSSTSSKLFSLADSVSAEPNPFRTTSSLSLTENNLLHNEPSTSGEDDQVLFQQQQQTQPLLANEDDKNDEASHNSSSAASESKVQQLGEFLHDLRMNSQGQMRDASVVGSSASFESSIMARNQTEVEEILRQRRGTTTSSQQPHRIPSRYSMDYTKDSFSSIEEYNNMLQQQQQQNLVGDTIEIMVPSLPPLHNSGSTPTSTSGRKQAHDRQQRRPSAEKAYKSTIQNSADEWSNQQQQQQQQEIGMFSQYALGSTPDAYSSRRGSYRKVKRRSLQESGEDSDSHASDPADPSNHQPSPASSNAVPTPRSTISHGRAPMSGGSNQSNTGRSIQPTNSDGSLSSRRQPPPPLQLDSNGNYPAANMQWGVPNANGVYGSLPSYYYPAPSGHRRGASESPAMTQQQYFDMNQQHFHYHYPMPSHTRSQSSNFQQGPSPGSTGTYQLHSPTEYFTPSPQTGSHFFPESSRSYDTASQSEKDQSQPQNQRRTSYVYVDDPQRRDSYGVYVEDVTSYSDSDHSDEDAALEKERNIHQLHAQPMLTQSHQNNPFLQRQHEHDTMPKFDRRQFLPRTSTSFDSEKARHATFVCPNCNMRQREFFTVSSAPKQTDSEGMLISLVFGVYVVSSLYIFGLQEGWGKLDCFYFAVITLTTAGLGDLVPTTDGAKIICSIFIYFGVACIGLLLGSYIAGMLDERSYREAVANQIKACPNCARIRSMQEQQQRANFIAEEFHKRAMSMRRQQQNSTRRNSSNVTPKSADLDTATEGISTTPTSYHSPQHQNQKHLLSPNTTKILNRQRHTRHFSMDIRQEDMGKVMGNKAVASASKVDVKLNGNPWRLRMNSAEDHVPKTINEGRPSLLAAKGAMSARFSTENTFQKLKDTKQVPHAPQIPEHHHHFGDDYSTSDDDSSEDSLDSEFEEIEGRTGGSRNAKYVIFTLREALVNSLLIILFGCLGFYLIEGFSFVDSLYFTTVLLTSTGYGDIVPKSDGGKLFATVYLLVGGTILLNNMSMISMIPLELRKRRTEHSVLTQFGDSLDDDALRELATGPLIQRINLGGKDSRGLNECTREMFSLAMLIRLGKVTEHDIKLTFAAFRKLDVHNEGILNSKSIIGGLIQKRRRLNLMNNNGPRQSAHYGMPAQAHGYANPQPMQPSNVDGNRHRSSSTHSSFVPSTHANDVHPTDHAPLLSMSERGFPQYGMNQQHPFVPPMNQ